MIIQASSYPRVGLIGNPSDGYYGKTIGFAFGNFRATVTLYETPELEICPNEKDQSVFMGITELVKDVRHHGYYGGIRLLKATIRRFHDYCQDQQIPLHDQNFTLRYESTIPHGVGMAGSSAIITAAFRALMQFYTVSIQPAVLAQLVLEAETKELRIAAGLQDRVVQAYENLMYMDFDKKFLDKQGYGNYRTMDHRKLPNLYIAFLSDGGEPTEVVHSNLRSRYDQGVKTVHQAMTYWANLTDRAYRVIEKGNVEGLGELIDANFNRRRKICDLNPQHVELIDTARSTGASAKYTGSGGAIVGTYESAKQYGILRTRLKQIGATLIKPQYITPTKDRSK
jgi:glucuronokinase